MSRRTLAIGVAILAAAVTAGAAVAVVHQPRRSDDRTSAGTSADARPLPKGNRKPVRLGSHGVKPPAKGAFLGAWVQPAVYTEEGRAVAVKEYEAMIGRKLDVVHDFHTWTDEFPSPFDHAIARAGSIPLISWAGTDTKLIALGDEDELIRRRARAIKMFGKPVLLRWRWEMERPNLRGQVHSPGDYVAAWKRIRALFAHEGVTNASFVWCPLVEGFDDGRAQAYYPGDEHVEWICADAYTPSPSDPLSRALASFLTWADGRDKPIIIAEFGTLPAARGQRARWLAEVSDIVREYPQVKAMIYFDSDTEQRGTVRRWSLRSVPEDLAAFAALAKDPMLNRRRLSTVGQ